MNTKLSQMQKLMLEQSVYRVADEYYVGYSGGRWVFSRESVWSPKVTNDVNLVNPDNYSDVIVKPKTAGYALTLFAASQICYKYHAQGNEDGAEFWANFMETLRLNAVNKLSGSELSKFLSFVD